MSGTCGGSAAAQSEKKGSNATKPLLPEGRGVVRPIDGDLDRYRFWSSVVPPVMRRMLADRPAEERQKLHDRIAEAMIEAYQDKDRRARRALGIAYHLRRAGRPKESVPYVLTGCRRLVALSLSERARVTLGPWLAFDPERERFEDTRANEHLARTYRETYVVPERV